MINVVLELARLEMDIAASTTATGRKLLTYGKRVIEEVYKDAVCETKHGKVRTMRNIFMVIQIVYSLHFI